MKKFVVFSIIAIILIGVAIGGVLWGQRTAIQETTKVYKRMEAVESSKPAAESPQGGHPHADGTWHAGAHEQETIGQVQAQGTEPQQYPRLETHEDVQEYLRITPPEEVYARNRDMYIARHYKKYPDCAEHEAVVADAERNAAWFVANVEHRRREAIARAEFAAVGREILELPTDIPGMTEAEKASLIAKARELHQRNEETSRHYDEVIQQRPVRPKPTHTH